MGGYELNLSDSEQGQIVALQKKVIMSLVPQNVGNFLTSRGTVTMTVPVELGR